MKNSITSVQIVSDGIVVKFDDGKFSYFGQEFLKDSIGVGSNLLLLDHDPSFDFFDFDPKLLLV